MNIARDEKIDVAIAVVVGPCSAGAESAGTHASLLRHVFKFAVAQIVVERIAAVAGDVNILPSIVVVVSDGHAHDPAFAREASGLGDVGKVDFVMDAIGILVIERDHRIAAFAIARHRRAVDRDDVEFAVVIAVDVSHAATHGFHNVLFVGR